MIRINHRNTMRTSSEFNLKVSQHYIDKRSSLIINNKITESDVRTFLDRKIHSKHENFRTKNSINVLPIVDASKLTLNSEAEGSSVNFSLPSHF